MVPDDFVQLQELARVRAGLRQLMLSSRMCNASSFVSDLENVYSRLWSRWLQSDMTTLSDHSSPGSSDGMGNGTQFEYTGDQNEDDEVSLSHDYDGGDSDINPSRIPRPSTPSPKDDSD